MTNAPANNGSQNNGNRTWCQTHNNV